MRTEPAPLPKTPKRGSSESVVKSQLRQVRQFNPVFADLVNTLFRVLVAEDNQINRVRQLRLSPIYVIDLIYIADNLVPTTQGE
jgi:hypothetical protein